MTGVMAEWLTISEAAETLGVSVRTLAGWRSAGIGPEWRRFGPRSIRYSRASVGGWRELPSSPTDARIALLEERIRLLEERIEGSEEEHEADLEDEIEQRRRG